MSKTDQYLISLNQRIQKNYEARIYDLKISNEWRVLSQEDKDRLDMLYFIPNGTNIEKKLFLEEAKKNQ